MRYLVTGGFGYMGSWVVEHLLGQGHDVFVLSRRTASDETALGNAAHFVQADIVGLSPEELTERLPEELHGCVHAASFNESFTPGYAQKALQINALGTRNLLEALMLKAERAAAPLPTLVYCSTFHVYGRSSGHIDENILPTPRNDYALTHFFGEEYCRFFGRTRGLPHVIVRCTNGYGAPRYTPFDKWYLLFNDLCRNALLKGSVVLRSDPAVLRDFIWMGDVAAAIASLLGQPERSGAVFNLSSGQAQAIGHIAALAAHVASEYTGKPVPLIMEHGHGPESSLSLTNDPPELIVSNKALQHATGIVPQDHMAEEMLAILKFLTLHGDA